MKKCVLFLIGIWLFVSCVDQTYMDNTAPGDSQKEELDLSFSFQTRTNKKLTLKAVNSFGKNAPDVLFSIFTTNPDKGEGVRADISPIYQGYTDADGVLKADIAIPNGADSLFVYAEYTGFGIPQTVVLSDSQETIQLNFKGYQLQGNRAFSAGGMRAMSEVEFPYKDWMKRGVNYFFYSYLKDGIEVNKKGSLIPGSSSLVTAEELATDFLRIVDSCFQEKTDNYIDLTQESDLQCIFDEGTEVWATFIGDGEFVKTTSNQNVYNGLYYYTYTDETKPDKFYMPETGYIKNSKYHLTAVFPNVHPSYIAAGTKVQLLYFDEVRQVYTSKFPKGTYIGFAINRSGFNGINTGLNSYFDAGFGYSMSNNGGQKYMQFSSKNFNPDSRPHGIIHRCNPYDCYIVGMENSSRESGMSLVDYDYNDIMAKITTDVPVTQTGIVPVPPVDDPVVADCYTGTLAFEDLWPSRGDYDFNDFVTTYEYKVLKNASNQVTGFDMTFHPKAIGGMTINGFGIELPVSADRVKSVTGAELEEGHAKATLIILENVRNAYNNEQGYINTVKGSTNLTANQVTVHIDLIIPLNETILFNGFNPFLFCGTRGREVHLVDYAPTEKVNRELFGTNEDRSDASKGVYYRMDNLYPWALDIASNSGISIWRWPVEMQGISAAYRNYDRWTNDKSNISWFDSTIPENVNADKLY